MLDPPHSPTRPVRHVRHVRPVGTYHGKSPTFPVLTGHRAHRAQSYLWASRRAALAGFPVLLAQVPDMPGTVDATLAVRKDKSVLRQRVFSGPPHATKEDQR